MAAVKSLCKRGVILQNGMLVDSGDVDTIVSHYLKGDGNIENHKVWNVSEVKKEGFELLEIGVRKVDGDYGDVMRVDHDIEMLIRYRLKELYSQFHLTFHFKNEQGHKVFSSSGGGLCIPYEHKEGEYVQICRIPANFLNWGNYMVDMYVVKDRSRTIHVENDVISFTLANRQASLGSWMGREPGDVTPKFDYTEEKIG